MAKQFNIENFIINRPVRATLFSKGTNEVLFSADQLTESSLECSGTQVYVTDGIGARVAAFDREKNATFTASSAFMNFGLMAAQLGADKEVADETSKIIAPMFELIEVKDVTKITLSETPATEPKYIYSTHTDKSKDKTYTLGTAASATEFAVNGKEITLPTDAFQLGDMVAVWYERETTQAISIKNTAQKFSKGGRFVLEVLGCDICDQNTEYYAYLVFENSKLDNNVTLNFSNEGTHQFTVNAMQDYCSADNELFRIIVCK